MSDCGHLSKGVNVLDWSFEYGFRIFRTIINDEGFS